MNNKTTITALTNFKNAYHELLKEWSTSDSNDLNSLESIKHYPFHKSFDEIDITTWVDESIKEINEINEGE